MGLWYGMRRTKVINSKKDVSMSRGVIVEDEKIQGIVERVLFKNRDNGYHVISVALTETEATTVTLNQIQVHEGVTMEFIGQWTSHARFGKQFKANKAYEIPPLSGEALRRYLSSTYFPGIGPVISQRIIKHFGEDKVLDIFKNNINQLLKVPGVSKKKLEAIKESWEKNQEINDIMLFLQSYNISTLLAAKIYTVYGKDCIMKLKEDPYRLARDIKGVGFRQADAIALDTGILINDPRRVQASIIHVLDEIQSDGHCYLLKDELAQKSYEVIGALAKELFDSVLIRMVADKFIKTLDINGEDRYYSNNLYYAELYCAKKIKELIDNEPIVSGIKIEQWKRVVEQSEIQLSEEQYGSIMSIVKHGVSVLTGGPGCGKTTTLKYFVKLIDQLNLRFYLCAPTGRAAQRMEEVIGYQSSTIHRLLGWDRENRKFMHDEFNQLDADFLVVDETSMVDVMLANSLLRAVPDSCQILFVGDVDQLPPVGAGLFFKNLIQSGIPNVFVLNKIFRQAEGSKIIDFAHQINHKEEPVIENPLTDPRLWNQNADCLFIDSGVFDSSKNFHDYPDWSTLRYGLDALGMIKKLYTETIPKYFTKDAEIQILSPMNKGIHGSVRINEEIQEAINPESNEKSQLIIRQTTFREGDRIIHVVNNYDLGAMNGDIGHIVSIDEESITAEIKFPDGRLLEYKRSDLLELKLAYCVSIHKSQGSEFDCIIVPLMKGHYRMLYKQLLYTGLTRGKKLVVFVGERRAFSMAVQNEKPIIRKTSLVELLQQ